jgi:hypothetical protein
LGIKGLADGPIEEKEVGKQASTESKEKKGKI